MEVAALDHRHPHQGIAQDSLFSDWPTLPAPALEDSPLAELPAITSATTLAGVALPYRQYLVLSEHTPHTVDCFLSDLRLFTRFIGNDHPIGTITSEQITDWLKYLRWESPTPPAPKTMARRVTFLKNFFAWLHLEGVLPENLTASLVFARPQPPLPDLIFEDELQRLMEAARFESRSCVLVILALEGGLKKEEILALTLDRIDISDPANPTVSVRLTGQNRTKRDRLVALPASFTPAYQRYLRQYQPQEMLFECTDRNLTYILTRTVQRAGLEKRVTLQLLRDCYAVRQLRAGTPLAMLREKLGLSDEAWYEAQEKYRKLAFPA